MKMKSLACVFLYFAICQVNAHEICEIVKNTSLIAQDEKNTYLGKISSSYDSDSIFNEFGSYGSEYNNASIWNAYSKFGSEYNQFSPTNPNTSTPPMIIKKGKIIGYLSANKNINSSISPNLLKALCKEDM